MNMFFKIIAIAPPLVFSVMLHEIAHGLAAERFGDPTARRLGRISLNPLKHIDPVMTVLFPALLVWAGSPVIFGGAKPVPVNPLYFTNPRRGMAYVALAGPLSNLVLAALCYFALNGAVYAEHAFRSPSLLLGLVQVWLTLGLIMNVALAVFNLLPVPPLDGGRVAVGFLPIRFARSWARLEPFGILIVFGLLYLGVLDKVLDPALSMLERLPLLH